ncbi:MAG: type II toxin-antitoxin system RelE/ParE family toxin [Dehalococcoidia bacterium]|nr:hypothetical protein [Chloroflexota bacterium]MBT9162610.1 hypothetical protein [Chloroflexota bacterium]
MNFSFHPAAEQELNEAVDYYNQAQDGLGLQFAKEIYAAIQNILAFPRAWTPLSENTRRCLVNRFPYGCHLPDRRRANNHNCSDAPQQKARILEGQKKIGHNLTLKKVKSFWRGG